MSVRAGAGMAAAEPEPDAAALQQVRVQLKWAHQFQFAGYYAAIENGYYRDVGLDVSLIEYSLGVMPIDQLLGGRVDFAVADTGALLYRAAGVPLVAVAAVFQHSPSVLISLADSGIRELTDLRGRRVMLAGGYINAELMSMLQSVGITTDEIRMLPGDTNLDLLINGQTDAYNAYTTNELYALTQKEIPYVVFSPRKYGVDFYGDTLVTTEANIAADPELVRNFRDATMQGWTYAAEHPEEVVDIILEKYNTQNKSRDHLLFEARESIKLILPNIVPMGYMNEQRWQRIETIFHEQGLLTGSVDMNEFIYQLDDTSPLFKMMYLYRKEVGVAIGLLLGALMLFHILRLRTQIHARTKELYEAKLQAESEARTDALTNLPNRRYFFEELNRDIAQSERHGIPLSVISLDIDFFKSINDEYGHAAGDEALRNLADIFRKYTRSGDIAARIGGEEFAMACLNTTADQAHRLAMRLCQEIERKAIHHGPQSFQITVSIGIATHEKGDSVDQVLQKADSALYEAKQGGRNRVSQIKRGRSD